LTRIGDIVPVRPRVSSPKLQNSFQLNLVLAVYTKFLWNLNFISVDQI